MQESINNFLNHLEVERNYSFRTLKEYSYDLAIFAKFLNYKDITLVSIEDLRNVLGYLKKERGYSSKGIARKIATIKSFFKFLVKEGTIRINIADQINTPKLEVREPVFLTDEERIKLFDFAKQKSFSVRGKRNYAMLTILYHTGIRVSELINLNIDDIIKDENKYVMRIIGKGNKERFIPLNETVYLSLNVWLQNRPNTEIEKAVFIDLYKKNRLSADLVQYVIKQFAQKTHINKQITPHKLRHTFATTLLRKGANLVDIQALLGHASLNTTRIYTHTDRTQLRVTVDKLLHL